MDRAGSGSLISTLPKFNTFGGVNVNIDGSALNKRDLLRWRSFSSKLG